MCNLSEGIKKRGIEIGKERGITIGEKRGIAIGEERGEARLAKLISELIANGRTQDTILAINDITARKKLYREFNIH